MRPERLRLENFTCFRGVQEVDLTGLRLFAIAGPTGAGKSTLLDAIVFALYGRIPRLGARKLDEFISLGAASASVTLEFELNAERYRIARRMRRSGQKTAILERAEGVGLADGVRQVNDAVERLLGLSSEAFLQSVVLPQGDFARFLRSDPAERRKILQELLRLEVYEEMRRRADRRRARLWSSMETLRERLEGDYSDATPEALESAEARARSLESESAEAQQLRERLEDELRRLEELWSLVAERDQKLLQLQQAEKEARQVDALRDRLKKAARAETVRPHLEIFEKASADHREISAGFDDSQLERLEATARKAEAAHDSAEEAAAAIPAMREDLARLQQALPLVAILAEKRQAAEKLRGEAEAARNEAGTHQASAKRLETELGGIEADRDRLQAKLTETGYDAALLERLADAEDQARLAQQQRALHSDCVVELRATLKPGEPCPLCEQVYDAPVEAGPAQIALDLGLEGAPDPAREFHEDRLLRMLREQRAAHAQHQELASQLSRCEVRLAQAQAERDRARHAADTADDLARMRSRDADEAEAAAAELAAKLKDSDPEARSGELEAGIRSLERRLVEAREQRDSARVEASRFRERSAAIAASRAQLEQARARCGESVEQAGFDSSEAAQKALLDPDRRKSLEAEIDAFERNRDLLETRLRELDGALGDDAPTRPEVEDLRRRRSECAAECERLQLELGKVEARTERLRRDVERAAELRQQQTAHGKSHRLYHELADDLSGARFQAYLLDDAFGRLVSGASERLFELTERYELEFRDREFSVVDCEHGRESRSADTLSGGETFLASLALALELIQQVQHAAGAVRLDSMFIDEGFGALDPETLALVADTIESLDDGERMIGVITHVAELHERLPARVEAIPGAEGSRVRLTRL